MLPSRYRPLAHSADCPCSVCWALAQPVFPAGSFNPSSACPDCVPPGRPYQANGRWYCRPRFVCELCKLKLRPSRNWTVVSDTGAPTPFVPIREPFELV